MSRSPMCFCSERMPKSVSSRWFSFRLALLKLETPMTVKPRVGWPGLLGIWKLAVEAAQDQADARVRIDDVGQVGQAVELVRWCRGWR